MTTRTFKTKWLQLDGWAGDWFGVYSCEVPADGSEDPTLAESTQVGPLAIFVDRLDAEMWEPTTYVVNPHMSQWVSVLLSETGQPTAMFLDRVWAEQWINQQKEQGD